MDWMTVAAGGVPIAFGLATLIVRYVSPDSPMLGKYRAMQERWGTTAGTALHVVSYSVMPIAFGIGLIWAGVNGVSLLQALGR